MLNSSGRISVGGPTVGESINLELNRAATQQSNLNESGLRSLAGVPSGAIALSNFYGKSSLNYGTISANTGSVSEGGQVTFTYTPVQVPNGYYYWQMRGSGISSADFSANYSGNFYITNSAQQTITATLANDLTTEGGEYFNMVVGTDSGVSVILASSPQVYVSDTSQTIPAPDTPTGFSGYSDSVSSNYLYWNSTPNATGYYLYRNGGFLNTVYGTAYSDSGLSAGVQYSYQIQAFNNTGASPLSGTIYIQVQNYPAPSAPPYCTAQVISASQIDISWGASSVSIGYVSHYILNYQVNWGGWQTITVYGTSYSHTGLSPGTTYNYAVYAVSNYGPWSSWSPQSSATTQSLPSFSFYFSPGSVNEGDPTTLYVSGSNVPNNTTVYFTKNSGGADNSDLLFPSTSGAISTYGGSGSQGFHTRLDGVSEGTESLTLDMWTGGYWSTWVGSATLYINDYTQSYSMSAYRSGGGMLGVLIQFRMRIYGIPSYPEARTFTILYSGDASNWQTLPVSQVGNTITVNAYSTDTGEVTIFQKTTQNPTATGYVYFRTYGPGMALVGTGAISCPYI